MTLHELAESLRKVAYDLDESNRRWDANDAHVVGLNSKIARLEHVERVQRGEILTLRGELQRAEDKLRRRRRPAKKGKR